MRSIFFYIISCALLFLSGGCATHHPGAGVQPGTKAVIKTPKTTANFFGKEAGVMFLGLDGKKREFGHLLASGKVEQGKHDFVFVATRFEGIHARLDVTLDIKAGNLYEIYAIQTQQGMFWEIKNTTNLPAKVILQKNTELRKRNQWYESIRIRPKQ